MNMISTARAEMTRWEMGLGVHSASVWSTMLHGGVRVVRIYTSLMVLGNPGELWDTSRHQGHLYLPTLGLLCP
jgi:hypothetical protein